jgi:hypothetical protein
MTVYFFCTLFMFVGSMEYTTDGEGPDGFVFDAAGKQI